MRRKVAFLKMDKGKIDVVVVVLLLVVVVGELLAF